MTPVVLAEGRRRWEGCVCVCVHPRGSVYRINDFLLGCPYCTSHGTQTTEVRPEAVVQRLRDDKARCHARVSGIAMAQGLGPG